MSVDKLKNYILKNGAISTKDAVLFLGNRTRLYKSLEDENIEYVGSKGSGYLTLSDIAEDEAIFSVIYKYFPQCVISGKTALTLYGLGNEFLDKIDVDIPNSTSLRNSFLEVHRVNNKKIFNVEDKNVESLTTKVRIYSCERCLFEAYKYGPESEIFYRALKRYRSKHLNKDTPGEQYKIIAEVDKKLGSDILRLLTIEDVNE